MQHSVEMSLSSLSYKIRLFYVFLLLKSTIQVHKKLFNNSLRQRNYTVEECAVYLFEWFKHSYNPSLLNNDFTNDS